MIFCAGWAGGTHEAEEVCALLPAHSDTIPLSICLGHISAFKFHHGLRSWVNLAQLSILLPFDLLPEPRCEKKYCTVEVFALKIKSRKYMAIDSFTGADERGLVLGVWGAAQVCQHYTVQLYGKNVE